MSKKYIFLFVALALPGLIFYFLKRFGKNEFTVPMYFEQGIQSDSICDLNVKGVFKVPDSVLLKLGIQIKTKPKLIAVYPFIKDDLSEFSRVLDKYGSDLSAVVVTGVQNNPETTLPRIFLDYNEFGNYVYCLLRVKEPWSVVVLDDQNQIRGFYDGSRRDEMDRLDLELSILLKKY